ncbi:general odorant-binding protein 69a-like isoform X2 [Neodiprion virginianus]|uniref:general odorant-binding protein 69a-like isoform X2 n=1 Tax=Neodiprion virginianus TaxID=2961670 RepID=UPI001EE75307|nr:general odorant-binding protein 69a-like isoform X2 [Neodiprion virginianus]
MSKLSYGLVIMIFFVAKSMADDGMAEMLQMLHDTCVGQTGVAEDLIVEARTGNFADDPKLKFDDGNIDVETIVAVLPEHIVGDAEPVVRSCGTVKGSDDCDTAFQTNKCWYNGVPDRYMLA